jgi:hypothetical protein
MRPSLSTLTIIAVLATAVLIDLDLRLWEKRERVIEYDVHGYYGFLPALFIYDDIRLEKSDYRVDDDYYLFWPNVTPEGHRLIKYPVGLAMMYAPFFFAAHALAPAIGAEASGFSPPYKIALLLSALIYLWLGLLLLRRVLRAAGFADAAIAGTLLVVGIGTNLLCYSSQSATMPHVFGFFLVAALMHATLRWYDVPSLRRSLVLGLIIGLLTLVRPTNAVFVLFTGLYGIWSWRQFRERLNFLRAQLPQIALIVLVAALVWLPQFLYWHAVTGRFILYSYQEEGFFFTSPMIAEGLWGFRKGWLVYTPLMLFALAGLPLLRKDLRTFLLPVLLILLLHVHITFSWWCWWYGGTFGQRSMVEAYAMLAIPLAATIRYVLQGHVLLRWAAALLVVGGIWLNIFQTYQFEAGSLHHDAMTRRLYFKQFGRMEQVEGFHDMLDHPDYEKARTRKP